MMDDLSLYLTSEQCALSTTSGHPITYFVQCTYEVMPLPPISLAAALSISETFAVGSLDYFNEVRNGIDPCIFAHT